MKKIVFLIVLVCTMTIFVGCNEVKSSKLFVNLEISCCSNSQCLENLAITEIEDKITKLILLDYHSLKEDELESLCECILKKWQIKKDVSVRIISENLIRVDVGGVQDNVIKSNQIMLPLF